MFHRPLALSMFAVLIASLASAQDKSTPTPAPVPKTTRAVHVLRGGDPAILAETLSKHFKGDAEVSVLPAGTGNALLISGSAKTVAEATAILERADAPLQNVTLDVFLVELTLKKDDTKSITAPEFVGTVAEVTAKLDEFAKAGQVSGLQRLTLNAVEGQPTTATAGGSKPIVTAGAAGGFGGRGPGGAGGVVQRSVTYHPTGTTVQATTSRLGADAGVAVELKVDDSRVKPPVEGEDVGAAIDTAILTTKVNVPNGRAVTVKSHRVDGKAGTTFVFVIVAAKVTDTRPIASR